MMRELFAERNKVFPSMSEIRVCRVERGEGKTGGMGIVGVKGKGRKRRGGLRETFHKNNNK